MWHALRAELAYFLPWLLGGFGIAAGIGVLLHVLLHFFGEGEKVPSFLPAMFPILAGMVVSFVAQAYRFEERRVRLLLKGPLSPRQLGWVTALLPLFLVGAGTVVAAIVMTLSNLAGAEGDARTSRVLGVLAGQFLVYALLGTVIQEAVAAHLQGRGRSAIVAWVGIVATAAFCSPSDTAAQTASYSYFGTGARQNCI